MGKGKPAEACEALFSKHQVYLSLAPEHQNETAFAAMAAMQNDQVGIVAAFYIDRPSQQPVSIHLHDHVFWLTQTFCVSCSVWCSKIAKLDFMTTFIFGRDCQVRVQLKIDFIFI